MVDFAASLELCISTLGPIPPKKAINQELIEAGQYHVESIILQTVELISVWNSYEEVKEYKFANRHSFDARVVQQFQQMGYTNVMYTKLHKELFAYLSQDKALRTHSGNLFHRDNELILETTDQALEDARRVEESHRNSTRVKAKVTAR